MTQPILPVFISHDHADNDLGMRYATALRVYGVDVWVDVHNLEVGSPIRDEIEAQVKARKALAVLYSPAAVKSSWVAYEVNAFMQLKVHEPERTFIPVIIEHCDIPPFVSAIEYVDATQISFVESVRKIAERIGVPKKDLDQIVIRPGEIRKTPSTLPQVYVSHSRRGEDGFTKWLVRDLERRDITIYEDVGDPESSNFSAQLTDTLLRCDWVVFVATPAALRSSAVQTELDTASKLIMQHKMRGIILFSQVRVDAQSLAGRWEICHQLDASGEDYTEAYHQLLYLLGVPLG